MQSSKSVEGSKKMTVYSGLILMKQETLAVSIYTAGFFWQKSKENVNLE